MNLPVAAPAPPLQLLLVVVDDGQRAALRRAVTESDLRAEAVEATGVAAACALLAERRFDVVFFDHEPGHGDAPDLLDGRGTLNALTPFIALTGDGDADGDDIGDELAATGTLQRGAIDHLPRSQVTPRAVRKRVRDALRLRDLEAGERAARREALAATRARDAVMAVVSHDLRSPLGTITMGAALLRESFTQRGADAASELSTLGRMERASRSMQSLMADLQDVARIDAGTFRLDRRSVRLSDVLREVTDSAQLQARAAGVDVSVESTAPGLSLELDQRRIQQALGKLVCNALKVTPRRGVITLKAELVDGLLRLSVGDSGGGLEPEQVERAFDCDGHGPSGPGASTRMGFFLVRSIAEAHGGRAEVRSELGRGSTFSIVLPTPRSG